MMLTLHTLCRTTEAFITTGNSLAILVNHNSFLLSSDRPFWALFGSTPLIFAIIFLKGVGWIDAVEVLRTQLEMPLTNLEISTLFGFVRFSLRLFTLTRIALSVIRLL